MQRGADEGLGLRVLGFGELGFEGYTSVGVLEFSQ